LDVALKTVADGVIGTDAQHCITLFNPGAESVTGWRSSEAVGKPLFDIFPLVDRETGAVLQRPATGAGQASLVTRGGRAVEIAFTAASSSDARGRFAGAVIAFRPADADALFEEKERAQVTLNSIGDAVITTDFSGRVNYLNIVAEKMTGWNEGDAAGRAVDEIFHLAATAAHETIPCPTAQAIIENRRVLLEAQCVLIPRSGEEVAVEISAAPIHDRNGGVIGAVMVAHDVTVARDLSRKLARLALHDSLTDLPNRALLSERLSEATAARVNHGHVALLYVDLDRFKPINDSLGHAVGDQLLQTVARRLTGCVRSSDTVSRQGGDEFVVLLPDIVDIEDAVCCAQKILRAVEAPYRIGGHELRLSASIGVAIYPDHAGDGEGLLRCADSAMYQAKYEGRNSYKLFNQASLLEEADAAAPGSRGVRLP
jgi:diguanylate cyclase (GGDEF)-like protein/PAS domain S-box-containing protein